MVRVFSYKKCSTCRKALTWLQQAGVEFEEIDITVEPPTVAELRATLELSGLPLPKLFNTSGQSYRNGHFKERLPKMSDNQALSALHEDGKLIKRPLVLGNQFALVGFNEEAYRTTFKR